MEATKISVHTPAMR